jgi:phenylacetate-CoA ligase
LLKPGAIGSLRRALQAQRLPPEALEELNWQRTKALVRYAFEQVPYYQRRFREAGLHPDDLQGPETFVRVPVLTRQDLKGNFQDLVSVEAKPRQLRTVTTGGSTGEPVKVYHQKSVVREAMRWRMLGWWGLGPGDDMASVYRDMGASLKARLANTLLCWPSRRILLNASSLDTAPIRRFLEEFARLKPALLHGYVGAMDHLAQFMLDQKIQVPSPKAIWVTSAPLTPVQQRRIESAFGAPVYDQYGSCEVYWLAAQCPAKGPLHMFHDVRRIEFLDKDNRPCREGELGNIAVTDLENRLFPLIRYLNGDMSRRMSGLCSCGLTLPLMDKVRGRTTDIVKLPDGGCISGDYLTTLFDDYPDAVRRFQVHQKADYSIEILVVPEPAYERIDRCLADVSRLLRDRVRNEVPVTVVRTEEIASVGGKLRFVRSEAP